MSYSIKLLLLTTSLRLSHTRLINSSYIVGEKTGHAELYQTVNKSNWPQKLLCAFGNFRPLSRVVRHSVYGLDSGYGTEE